MTFLVTGGRIKHPGAKGPSQRFFEKCIKGIKRAVNQALGSAVMRFSALIFCSSSR